MNSRVLDINLTNIKFKNSTTVYETFIKCTIKDYEMNLSYNPTLLSGSQGMLTPYSASASGDVYYISSTQNYGDLKDFVTGSISGSEFSPYVAQVGLYNDAGDLLAVAKMAAPMPLSTNTDQTFLVKWDTKWSPKPYFTPTPTPSSTPQVFTCYSYLNEYGTGWIGEFQSCDGLYYTNYYLPPAGTICAVQGTVVTYYGGTLTETYQCYG